MGVFSNKISRDDLKPGDHIYSWRNAYLYSHHGIYAGEGKVIHFTRGPGQEIGTGTFIDNVIFSSSGSSDRSKCPCAVCGDQSNLTGVISSCLDCFLWDGELYLFEYGVSPAFFLAKARGGTCTLAKSDPAEDALSRASHLLANGFGVYNIFKNNCEDFAIYCKTGLLVVTDISVGRSGQATAFVAALSAVVSSPLRFLTTSFSGLTAVGCGMYCVSRFVSDIGMRRDVMKIPVERLVGRTDLSQPTEAAINKPMETLETAIPKPIEAAIAKPTEAANAQPTEAAIPKPIPKPIEAAIAKPTEAANALPTEAAIPKPIPKLIEAAIGKPTEAANAQPTEAANAEPTEAANAEPTEAANVKPTETANAKPTETANIKQD